MSDVANGAGKPDSASELAAANGVEDIRNPEVDAVASPSAAAAAGAAEGALGSPLSGNAGAGRGAGAGAGFGADFGRPNRGRTAGTRF